MRKFIYSFLFVAIAVSGAFLASPALAAGASLYLSPSTGTEILNSKFTVAIKLSTADQSINAGQASLTYDKSLLKVLSIAKGSVFSLWTEEPTFSAGAGTIEFGGGVPRPGYTGNGGTVCVVTFQAIKLGTAAINFTSGDVLANDGMGTNILSSMGSASFNITPKVEAPTPTPVPNQPAPAPTAPTPAPVETASYNRPEITSATHPDQTKWYKALSADFTWKLPAAATGVSIAFDQKADTVPGNVADGLFDSKQYTVDHDGSWYIHVKVKDDQGRWGTPGHFRVNIDSTPPKDFTLSVKQDDPNDWPTLSFQTTDELSGLDKYELLIDSLSAEPIILTADKTSYKLVNLEVGSHTVAVKAIDLAGNETMANLTFDVSAVATPVIKNYSAQISQNDKFFISGTANPNNSINIYLQGSGQPEMTTVKSDADGNWFEVAQKNYTNGQYTAWVEAVNPNGLKSKPSAKVSFLVTAPVFARIGSFVLNYFTVIVSLLFIIVLIIAILVWLWEFVRKRLKRETLEIEDVLEKNIEELKVAVSEELDDLGKLSKTEFVKGKTKVKNSLNDRIDETNKRILKEIRDVEKILK